LLIEGSVGADKADAVQKFTKSAYDSVLSGINKRTAGINIEAKLGVGDPYKVIEGVADIHSGDEKTIIHKPGQVILIDFWATWCPPCQAPMAHNQHMLEHHGEKWGDKVRLIGISIDQTAEAVVKHVQAKGWEKVEHYHRAGSSCDDDYGVSGVPHVVLVDSHGRIAYAGHPAVREIEKDIEALMKGEKLKGVEGGDGEEEEDSSAYKELNLTKIKQEMEKFSEQV
jgi:thiol-disulfide isomerase/thioredoxin